MKSTSSRDRLDFLDRLARPLYDLYKQGYWRLASISIECAAKSSGVFQSIECGDAGSETFRERIALETTSQPGCEKGAAFRFILITAETRVRTHLAQVASIFSASPPPLHETIEFWRSIESVWVERLDRRGRSVEFVRMWSAIGSASARFAQSPARSSSKEREMLECLMVLILERPLPWVVVPGGEPISMCFDMPRVWMAHGARLASGEFGAPSLDCMLARSAFFGEYRRIAAEFAVDPAVKCRRISLLSLHDDIAAAVAAMFPNVVSVWFKYCDTRAEVTFINASPQLRSIVYDSGLLLFSQNSRRHAEPAYTARSDLIQACCAHPNVASVQSADANHYAAWAPRYLSQCLREARAVRTLIELDAPSLNRESTQASPVPAGVSAFFRHPLFERNVLRAIRKFTKAADIDTLMRSVPVSQPGGFVTVVVSTARFTHMHTQ